MWPRWWALTWKLPGEVLKLVRALRLWADFLWKGFELKRDWVAAFQSRVPVSSCQKRRHSYHHDLLLTAAVCPSHTGKQTTVKCGLHWGVEACRLFLPFRQQGSLQRQSLWQDGVLQRRRNTLCGCSLLETRASTGGSVPEGCSAAFENSFSSQVSQVTRKGRKKAHELQNLQIGWWSASEIYNLQQH